MRTPLHFSLLMLFLLTTIGSAQAVPCGRPAGRPFKVFNGLSYLNQPDLTRYGIEPLHIVDRGIWRDPNNRFSAPDPDLVRRYIESLPHDSAPVVLDFEDYDERGSDQAAALAVQNLSRISAVFRSVAPDRAYGFYGVLPERDYWRAIQGPGSPKYQAWQHENDRVRALERNVDMLFPSLYTFYPDQTGWAKFARAQICEARRISSKPVYVFLWPEYHGARGQFISGPYWRLQLDTALQYADGIVLWGGYDIQHKRRREWDSGAAWWRETMKFVRGLQLSNEPPNS